MSKMQQQNEGLDQFYKGWTQTDIEWPKPGGFREVQSQDETSQNFRFFGPGFVAGQKPEKRLVSLNVDMNLYGVNGMKKGWNYELVLSEEKAAILDALFEQVVEALR